ncbi:MAG: hypothetical protein H6816_16260 [Phycisphaerales bacterium]|nr:hypothetical protein [Phycisphaerales bacterium]
MFLRVGRAAGAVCNAFLLAATACAICLLPRVGWSAALGPDASARVLAGMAAKVPAGVPMPEAKFAEYARRATANWEQYERHIGAPMQKWATAELVPAPGGTIFYPFSGPDFATVYRMYPNASRYVLVAMQRAEPPPALEAAKAADLAGFMGRFADAWRQFAQIGFFRTLDLDEEAKQPGLRAGTTAPMLAFAVRSGFTVVSVEPIGINASGSDVETHPGPRSDRSTWNSVRITLQAGGRQVLLDYIRMNLSDASLNEHPAQRAWVQRMAAHPTVLKAASHLPQSPRFAIVRDALLEHAPSILQDETGIEYTALSKVFDVKLYGRFTKPHPLFNQDSQKALAQAYKAQPAVKPLTFRVSYQRQPEANLQVANRKRPAGKPAAK